MLYHPRKFLVLLVILTGCITIYPLMVGTPGVTHTNELGVPRYNALPNPRIPNTISRSMLYL